jgi:hypothetical protein
MLSGRDPNVYAEVANRSRRRRDRGGFGVAPQEDENGEEVYVVVGPTGAALYSFTDIREAIAEAADLNETRMSNRAPLP